MKKSKKIIKLKEEIRLLKEMAKGNFEKFKNCTKRAEERGGNITFIHDITIDGKRGRVLVSDITTIDKKLHCNLMVEFDEKHKFSDFSKKETKLKANFIVDDYLESLCKLRCDFVYVDANFSIKKVMRVFVFIENWKEVCKIKKGI